MKRTLETHTLHPMVVDSSEKNLRSENLKSNGDFKLGFSTEEALKRLSNEIQNFLESYEKKFKKERSVLVPLTSFRLT